VNETLIEESESVVESAVESLDVSEAVTDGVDTLATEAETLLEDTLLEDTGESQ